MKKAAYLIPLAILLYILYQNYLPFGYDETFVIDAGTAGDRDGEFYLETSGGLSPRMTTADGSTYRELSGFVYTVFKPDAILRNATATVSVADEGVSLISPHLEEDPTALPWEYRWDNAASSSCVYFDGVTNREMIPSAAGSLDSEAFSVYAEWTPEDPEHAAQLIVGHYHWELIQNKDDVEFYIRNNEGEQGIHRIRFAIDDSKFFGEKHTALAIYAPSEDASTNGYIDLYIDNEFAGRTYFGSETVMKEGLAERDITLGKSGHSDASFFKGCISDIRIMGSAFNTTKKEFSFPVTREHGEYAIPLINSSKSPATLKEVKLHVIQE